MATIVDLWRGATYDERGDVNLQSGDAALLSAVENWILSPRGTSIRGKDSCGIIYRYMGNKYLTDEYCNKLRNELTAGLKYDFDPPLEVSYLEVTADNQKRAFIIYGEVYSQYYGAKATINVTVEQG